MSRRLHLPLAWTIALFVTALLLVCSQKPPQQDQREELQACLERNKEWRELKREDANTAEFWQKADQAYRACTVGKP